MSNEMRSFWHGGRMPTLSEVVEAVNEFKVAQCDSENLIRKCDGMRKSLQQSELELSEAFDRYCQMRRRLLDMGINPTEVSTTYDSQNE